MVLVATTRSVCTPQYWPVHANVFQFTRLIFHEKVSNLVYPPRLLRDTANIIRLATDVCLSVRASSLSFVVPSSYFFPLSP